LFKKAGENNGNAAR